MKLSDRIIPTPQRLCVDCEKTLKLGKKAQVSYALQGEGSAFARLEKELALRFGCAAKEDGKTLITLAAGNAPEQIPNEDQGYSIEAKEGKIDLIGFGEAGLAYAVTTLLQILKEEDGAFTLPAFTLLDYPVLKKRGHFIETRYGTDLMELEDWKQVVDSMAEQKQNHLTVSVYGCWCVQYDNRVSEYVYLPFKGHDELKTPVYKKYYSPKKGDFVMEQVWTPMAEKDYFGRLRAYGKERGVEVIPMFNSLGHNTLLPRIYPEVSAKDEEGKPSYTGFCTANPKTYELLFDLYDQIIDRYGKEVPLDAFDIGLDEVRDERANYAPDVGPLRSPWCKCPACRDKSHREILFAHAARLMKYLKSRGIKTVYMYNDMVVEHKMKSNNYNPADYSKEYRDMLVKEDLLDVACLDWWSYTDNYDKLHFHDLRPQLGIRSTAKPWNGYYNWAFLSHPIKNIYYLSRIAKESCAEGLRSYSSWDNSYHRNNQMQADYAWNFDGTGEPLEAKARYVRRYFGESCETAEKAFTLMEDVTRKTNPSVDGKSSRHDIFFEYLSYYRYTYYRQDLEFPRNYPGALVPKLREEPAFVEDLKEMVLQSQEAIALWDKVAAKNPRTAALALRYRYECVNYANLCRDWLCIYEMDLLSQSFAETKDPAAPKKIAALAREQKESRLAELALLEQIKEDYLIPSHARNQTIPMQYFADVEAYLASTPLEELKLDFADMRHIASETFTALR